MGNANANQDFLVMTAQLRYAQQIVPAMVPVITQQIHASVIQVGLKMTAVNQLARMIAMT